MLLEFDSFYINGLVKYLVSIKYFKYSYVSILLFIIHDGKIKTSF